MQDKGLESRIRSLRKTLRTLRGDGGCPWDRQRTLGEIASYLIDEAYEILHAEQVGDIDGMEEELGDILFLVVFIHELMLERRPSSLADIVSDAHMKIVRRHPHVFGDEKAGNEDESLHHWERIKREERGRGHHESLLDTVPRTLPPLRRALDMQKKAAATGFDWAGHEGVIEKLREETGEILSAIDKGDPEGIRGETGDLLFTVVNLARVLHVDCESALAATCWKFERRFRWMEKAATESGRVLDEMSLEEMEALWQNSKAAE